MLTSPKTLKKSRHADTQTYRHTYRNNAVMEETGAESSLNLLRKGGIVNSRQKLNA